MAARFDHLVVAVEDLDEAAARWRAAGLPAVRGGRHLVGTENVLVRGPQPAYVELIAAASDESNPWLDRVREGRGPISWAIAVDDVEEARAVLEAAGFGPRAAVPGSRTTPDGDVVGWKVCDLGPGPYDGSLPFLIEWTTPMPPGPADGPVVQHVGLTPPDPERVADVLLALGFVPSAHWPRRMFHPADGARSGGVGITLSPVGVPEVAEPGSSWFMSWEEDVDEPATSLSLATASPEPTRHTLDGTGLTTHPDHRRHPAAGLLPAVDAAFARLRGELADWPDPHPGGGAPLEEEYSRVSDPERYRLLAARADAWVEAVVAAGLGSAQVVAAADVAWVDEQHLAPSRVTVLRGRPGTVSVTVGLLADDTFVVVGVGDPVEVLDRQPDCGCDACDTGSAELLGTVDDAFILALSGGVHVVRDGGRVVRRTLDGWSASGQFAGGEPEQWLAEAAEGRPADGVVAGDAWL